MGQECFQIIVTLEDKTTMPNYRIKLEDNKGSVSKTTYYINKETYYPIKMRGESYSTDTLTQSIFIDQKYYDIEFNPEINETLEFNTSQESIVGYEAIEMRPE
jgi:hypothetical protein